MFWPHLCCRANVPTCQVQAQSNDWQVAVFVLLGSSGGSVGLIGLGCGPESDRIKKSGWGMKNHPVAVIGMMIWSFQKPWNKDPYEPISRMKCHALKWLMEEILNNHLGCIKPNVNNRINYQPQLVSRISSIHSSNGKWTRIESMYFLLKVRWFSSSYMLVYQGTQLLKFKPGLKFNQWIYFRVLHLNISSSPLKAMMLWKTKFPFLSLDIQGHLPRFGIFGPQKHALKHRTSRGIWMSRALGRCIFRVKLLN